MRTQLCQGFGGRETSFLDTREHVRSRPAGRIGRFFIDAKVFVAASCAAADSGHVCGDVGQRRAIHERGEHSVFGATFRRVRVLVCIAFLPLLANCAGAGAAADRDTVANRRAAANDTGSKRGGIENAELPFEVMDREGGAVSKDDFYAALAEADAVCLGESHRNPHHHWLQLHVLEHLTAEGENNRPAQALGMEMFQRPFQRPLSDFQNGKISEDSMLSRTGWKARWGYDYTLYKPMIDMAVDRGLDLVALNAPKELTRKIGRKGLDALDDDERAQLPELDLDDADHRAWFDGIMGGHGAAAANSPHGKGNPHGKGSPHGKGNPHGDGSPHGESSPHGGGNPHGDGESAQSLADRIYTAQVTWDETMAATSAEWLNDGRKPRQIVILAGSGHCHDRAIVARIKRRGPDKAVSVLPVIDTGKGEVSAALVKPKNDFIVVMKLPK